MTDEEEVLRAAILIDAKVYRARNQIMERTDPQAKQQSKERKLAKLKPQPEPEPEPVSE